jgi:hypothetical protein
LQTASQSVAYGYVNDLEKAGVLAREGARNARFSLGEFGAATYRDWSGGSPASPSEVERATELAEQASGLLADLLQELKRIKGL